MPKLAFFSSFPRTRNRIVERLKRGPQARPTEGFYGCEKFEKMLWFCDVLILNKDSVFIAVKRGAIFYTRYVKVVPFVRGRYTKGLPFLSKMV